MNKRGDLPVGVFPKGRWYYLVTAQAKKRIWTKLSKIADGLPALYLALAEAKKEATGVVNVPALIATWQKDVMQAHSARWQANEISRGKVIAEAFVEFQTVAEIETPDCSTFLAQFKATPRTFNAYRSQLRELFRYAEEKGLRAPGTNPIQAIRTMRTQARDRYITDSELRRIKVAAMRWTPESNKVDQEAIDTRSGPMLCALIDMGYLTGQAIGDLLSLEWSDLGRDGIFFARAKVSKSTKAKVVIGWTPKLRDVERRLKELRKERRAFGTKVFCRQDGQPYTYSGVRSAWSRTLARAAGVAHCTFHDIKAKALTDKDAREGIGEARKMGQHSTEAQTADYLRHKVARKTGATR